VGEARARDLTGGKAAERKEEKVEVKPISAMATAMSSSRNLDARRRLSQSAQLRARPLLVEA
jgi:omega-6 fatty acid desaturase (delta-12 desaturase)